MSTPRKSSQEAEVRPVDLFEYLAERLISKAAETPITVEIRFADGTKTFQITKKDPWFKALNARRLEALRFSFRKREQGGEPK